jgi:hypothetical protein
MQFPNRHFPITLIFILYHFAYLSLSYEGIVPLGSKGALSGCHPSLTVFVSHCCLSVPGFQFDPLSVINLKGSQTTV